MPRASRERSNTGFYHVMIRGNGKQIIFEEDADRTRFLGIMRKRLATDRIACLAWCLMDNHVHLLLQDEKAALSHAMQCIGTAYAKYFNEKYGHTGSVFENRFKSVAIKDDRQLIAATLYIHDNPVRAGFGTLDSYQWSSYQAYSGLDADTNTCCKVVLELVGGAEAFRAISNQPKRIPYHFKSGRRVADEDAVSAACVALDGVNAREIAAFDAPKRNQALRALRDAGLSVRQIIRLTGMGRYAIELATRQAVC